MFRFKAGAQPVVFEQVPDLHQENQPDADGGKNIVHRLGCREVAQKRIHPAAERTEYRRVDKVQTVHDLFGDPFDNAVKNPHALCRPLTAGEERRDIGHDEAEAVQDRPGDCDAFEPCARFLDCPTAAGKVHHQKRDRRSDDGGDGRDEKDLLIDVLHDLRCLFPDRRGRSRLDQKRQDADAEPCDIEPAPRTFPRRRKLRQIVGCVQRCSSFSFPDAKSRRPIRASARNKIQFYMLLSIFSIAYMDLRRKSKTVPML